jgi:hypothetical protein
MKKRHKKKEGKPQSSLGQAPQLSRVEKRQEEHRAIKNSFLISLAITFVLLGLKSWVERSDFGRLFEQMTYDLLQLELLSTRRAQDVPIVLDISPIPLEPSKKGSDARPLTRRQSIQQIVEVIATKEKAPLDIGVDIDFSPTVDGYADPYDPTLFDFLLKKKADTNIPIFVGVHDSVALGPENWLRDRQFIDLAACIAVPIPEKGQSTMRMPEWIELNYSPSQGYTIKKRCPALGALLAHASVERMPTWAGLFVRSEFNRQESALTASEFLVDYSPLDELTSSKVEVGGPSDVVNLSVRNRMVLLGRATNTNDMFVVPGRHEKPYPGVFLHACAAYTLRHSRPLYYLTSIGRCSLDVLFSMMVFGSVLLFGLHLNKKSHEETGATALHSLLTFVVVLSLVVLAVRFVQVHHLMWDDFILVVCVLLAHSPLERAMGQSIRWLSKSFRRA